MQQLKRRIKKSDSEDQADEIVGAIEFSSLSSITSIQHEMESSAADASRTILEQVEVELNTGIVNQVNARAAAYAKQRAADLVTQIEDTTRTEMRDLIAGAIEDNLSIEQIGDLIQQAYSFSEERAQLIADTEIKFANGAGALEGMQMANHEGHHVMKAWWPDPNACPICQGNADQGQIELDDEFESGDDAPPAHPNCECVLISVLVKENGDETDEE